MKNLLLALILLPFINGCTKDRVRNNNPYLPDYSFSFPINTNLGTFSQLNFNVQPLYINVENVGIRGIIVMKISDTDFRAWEAACPNQNLSDCSTMVINGLNAKCNCDNLEYSLFTGVGAGQYPMKAYRVQVISPTSLVVSN
ncbi:hypothetical protein [Flavobacterium sp.]|jgi:hypothetical protein|uniref:hypothetical protein n=1 Tax=Flavobacterium sp. TaxID=239 RepID=UPI0037BFA305